MQRRQRELLFQRHLFHLCQPHLLWRKGTPGCLWPPHRKARRLAQMTTSPEPKLSLSLSGATLLHPDFFSLTQMLG